MKIDKLNLAQLRAFHAVAMEGSFTTAARVLHVTQPTISAQVKGLEDTYGVRLLDRRSSGVELTDIGQTLSVVTNQMFALEQQAEDILSASRQLKSGHLKIGADGPHHVMPLLARFQQSYPGITVTLDMGNAEEVLQNIMDYRIDVAVVAKAVDDAQLYAIFLRKSPLVVFVSRRHPWAGKNSIPLKDIANERLIVRETSSMTRQIFDQALYTAGIKPKAVMQIDSREGVREAVAAGLGVGVVAAAEFDQDVRLHTLPVRHRKLEISEYVVCLQERRRLRVVQGFLEVAQATSVITTQRISAAQTNTKS